MKKIIIFALIVTLIASAFGCARDQSPDEEVVLMPEESEAETDTVAPPDTENEVEDKQPTPEKEPEKAPEKEPEVQNKPQTEQPVTENKQPEKEQAVQKPPVEVKPAKAPDYKSFECEKISKWKQVRFTNDANVTLQFEVPNDWVLSKSANGYNISRDEVIIGTISQKKPDSPTAFYDYETLYDEKYQILKSYQNYWYHTNDGDTVARLFEFSTDQGKSNIQMYLYINYTELDDSAKAYMTASALTVPKAESESFPALSETNGSKKILLLGNSFINSSRVNVFLSDMLRDTGYTLTTVARGNAQVYTFSNDSTICEQIRNGEYAYVLVGCFYGENSIPAVKVLLDYANLSNTKLIVFPAHNESNGIFERAMDTYDGLTLLNWRGEINSLIDGGMDKWIFCVDDTYQHSTVYAGYVGAHMVYRKIFNKVPPKLSNAPLTQAQVDANIPGYSVSMHTPEPPEEIHFNGVEYKI